MNKPTLPKQKVWNRPEVTRLGKIRDVAGQPGTSKNGSNLNRT